MVVECASLTGGKREERGASPPPKPMKSDDTATEW